MHRKISIEDRVWGIGIGTILALIGLAVLLPIWYVLTISVTPFDVFARTGGSLFVPFDRATLAGYQQVLTTQRIPRAFLVSIGVTLVGTFLNLVVTTLMAYPLSKKHFALRNPLLLFVLFTLLFNGGLVPTYIVVRDLHLLNSYWALILPNLVSPFNLLVMKAFFQNLPQEIEEAARIDGAPEWQVLWRVVLPLSKPIMATVALFYGVAHWNSFFDAVLYISSTEKQPLQVVLRSLLSAGSNTEYAVTSATTTMPIEALRMAAVVITTVPVLVVYPFLQRYFTAGVLLGSVKE